ncbi:MAG: aminotransferase class I/II-fold pyridoxal phosphate-dependent enzyme, partial [Lachnospiraceae bacterium]|nr:aminotransferase class I/II-fold pyridoxal phosphate-dependent enzyme [Lachnospiraceae bacterium]
MEPKTLWEKLWAYNAEGFYPCHMPGHKRRWGQINGQACPDGLRHSGTDGIRLEEMLQFIHSADITELLGFDNLAHPTGLLKELQEKAARVFGAEESWFLVGGSTAGIMVSVFAAFQRGDEVLLAPNCHLSVWRAAHLGGMKPVLLETGSSASFFDTLTMPPLPTAEEVRQAFQAHPALKGMVLTSPSYEGAVADVRGIADAVHGAGGTLVVDCAHGAHFGFHPAFPESPVRQGADLVVQSLHKTLPAMTQTAILHRASDRVDSRRIRRFLNTFQTSSPSYVLLASIDSCVNYLGRLSENPIVHAPYSQNSDDFRVKVESEDQILAGTLEKVDDDGQSEMVFGRFAGKLSENPIAYAPHSQNSDDFRDKVENEDQILAAGQTKVDSDGRPEMVFGRSGGEESRAGFERFIQFRKAFDREMEALQFLQVYKTRDYPGAVASDPGKVVFGSAAFSGPALAAYLRKAHKLELEMAAPTYCVAIMTVADGKEGWERLAKGLLDADGMCEASEERQNALRGEAFSTQSGRFCELGGGSIGDAPTAQAETSQTEKDESGFRLPKEGEAAEDFAAVYPPGIPLICPGETWTAEKIGKLEAA